MTLASKRTIPLIALFMILAACTKASPTAISTEVVLNTPVNPTVEHTISTLPPTLEASSTPTEAPNPTNTLVPSATPKPLGGSRFILFGTNQDGSNTILYLLNTTSGDVTPLTLGDSNVFPGPFSPSGDQLLFTGFGLTHSFVGVMNADGSNPVDLTRQPQIDNAFPGWSLDGTQIVFTSRRDGNNEIYIMNADGSEPKRLTNNPKDDFAPAWSPDGTKIAFVSDRDNATGINNLYLMNVDSSGVTRLTNGNEIDYGPAFSPDGKQIAFRADVDGNGDIYLINADGSGRVNLTNNPASDWAPAWSPDGSLIAFQTNRDGNWEIYVMHSDGTEPTNLTQNLDDDQMPYWKPVVSGSH